MLNIANRNREFLIHCLRDLPFFANKILDIKFTEFQKELTFEILRHQFLLIKGPVQHGKSTVSSIALPIWLLSRDRNMQIGLCAATDDLAVDFLHAIREHFEHNEKLINNFGTFYDANRVWKDSAIKVYGAHLGRKDSSIHAFGAGSSFQGRHYHVIILDDPVYEGNSQTVHQREKLNKWYWNSLRDRLLPGGKIIVLGNPWEKDDLFDVLSKSKIFVTKHYQAIISDNPPKVLTEEFFDYETLKKRRAENLPSFLKRYQSILPSEIITSITTSEEFIKCLNTNISLGMFPPVETEQTVTICDPMVASPRSKSYAVVMTYSRLALGKRRIIDLHRGRWDFTQLKSIIANHARKYGTSPVIESNAFQRALIQSLQEEEHINCSGRYTSQSKHSHEFGIIALASLFAPNKIEIPFGDANSQILANTLKEEITAWPAGKTDDLVLGLWMAEREITIPSFAQSQVIQQQSKYHRERRNKPWMQNVSLKTTTTANPAVH